MDLSVPSGPKTLGGKLVEGADASTQFPSPVEDALERPANLKFKLVRREKLQKADPLLQKLVGIQNEIGRLRRHLEVIKRWNKHSASSEDLTNDTWRKLDFDVRSQLRAQEDLFWELNVPNVEERARLRILENLAYKEQSEERAQSFADFLSDSARFPRIKGLIDVLPKVRDSNPEKTPHSSRKGPISERLGELNSETPDPTQESSKLGLTQAGPSKVLQDPKRGQESQVSTAPEGTRISQLSPDTPVAGRGQVQRPRANRLNPQRRQAKRQLDQRAPKGAPQYRAFSLTNADAPPNLNKKARKAGQGPPRAADGPSESRDPDPGVAIDLTDELPEAGAPPSTEPKDTGRADPPSQEKAQEGGEQRADSQAPTGRVGRTTPDHWEDELEKSGGDPPEGRAKARGESSSDQGEDTDFEF